MTIQQPPVTPATPTPAAAGYVPAFSGADGQEDPAPEAVVSSIALPQEAQPARDKARDSDERSATARSGSAGEADDGRFQIAEEVSTDLQTDQARRVGHMPETTEADRAAGIPDPAQAVEATLAKKNPPESSPTD